MDKDKHIVYFYLDEVGRILRVGDAGLYDNKDKALNKVKTESMIDSLREEGKLIIEDKDRGHLVMLNDRDKVVY